VGGDSVLFKRGDVFIGTWTTTTNGASGNPIVFAPYGTGAQPVLTGFYPITNWTNVGTNLWRASFPQGDANLNAVRINGVLETMGRWPDKDDFQSGWLPFESHSGLTSITDNQLTGTPNWTGGDIVIKKRRWIIDTRQPISNHTGTTMTYTSASPYEPINNYGYFIQNHLETVTAVGEWYWNNAAKEMTVYSINAPTNVQAAGEDYVQYNNANFHFTFYGLKFEGTNEAALRFNGSQGIKVLDCDINDNGKNSIYADGAHGIQIIGNRFNNAWNGHIYMAGDCNHYLVQGNTLRSNGLAPGMGVSSDNQYAAMILKGTGISEYNDLRYSGYHGMAFNNSAQVKIRYNFIDSICMTKDDGGGVYSFTGNDTTRVTVGREIVHNIVMHSVGVAVGSNNTTSAGYLIYLDDNVDSVTVGWNTMAFGATGLFLHNTQGINAQYNTMFNCVWGTRWEHDYVGNEFRSMTFKNNLIYTTGGQVMMRVWTRESSIASWGTLDSNWYCYGPDSTHSQAFLHEIGVGGAYDGDYYSLDGWKTRTGKDAASRPATTEIAGPGDVRFDHNGTDAPVNISVGSTYISPKGVVNSSGSIPLLPYSSSILIWQSDVIDAGLKILWGNWILI
jgi:hypothetical protein